MREARFAARLHHPNIVRVYDAGEQDGYFFMVMQYVDGPTVKDKLDGGECFTWREAVPIILAVCAGLQYAADEGVIHRDIKPDNIMIDRNGVPLLMDLGLAKGDAVLGAHLTQSADVLGTPFYMSPEQIRNPRETDRRADIYSLGATLYHMICGEPPFGGTSIYDVMNRHMREPLRSAREMAPDVPQPLCDIIAKMMAKERDDRYQDYSALIADLEHSLAGEGVAAQGAAGLLQTPEKTKGPGLTEMRAEQRYRPSRLPSTFLAPVAGLYALLCVFALIAGVLLLFHGLRLEFGQVAAWAFAGSVLALYAAYTVRLARGAGEALESDQQEARGSLSGACWRGSRAAWGFPCPGSMSPAAARPGPWAMCSQRAARSSRYPGASLTRCRRKTR